MLLIRKGTRIACNDGRPGHDGVEATVMDVDERGMTVQFDDRADTNYIRFSDHKWMSFIAVVE